RLLDRPRLRVVRVDVEVAGHGSSVGRPRPRGPMTHGPAVARPPARGPRRGSGPGGCGGGHLAATTAGLAASPIQWGPEAVSAALLGCARSATRTARVVRAAAARQRAAGAGPAGAGTSAAGRAEKYAAPSPGPVASHVRGAIAPGVSSSDHAGGRL